MSHRPIWKLNWERSITKGQAGFENDELTPGCAVCDAQHIGTMTPAYLLIRGAFAYSKDLGCEVFKVAPEAGLTAFSTKSGGISFVVDIKEDDPQTFVIHEECVELALQMTNADLEGEDVETPWQDERFREDFE